MNNHAMSFFNSHRLWRFECTFQRSDLHQWYNIWFHGHLQLWPWLHPGCQYITYMPGRWAVVWFTTLLQRWVISADNWAEYVRIMLHFVFFHSHRLWRFECAFQWSDQHHCYNVWFRGHLQLWPWLHSGWKYITYMPVQWAVVWYTALLCWWVPLQQQIL